MSAHMGRDFRKLYFVDAVVFGQDMLEVMLPVKADHWHFILVQAPTVNEFDIAIQVFVLVSSSAVRALALSDV